MYGYLLTNVFQLGIQNQNSILQIGLDEFDNSVINLEKSKADNQYVDREGDYVEYDEFFDEIIEDVFGAGFVICQSFIEHVNSSVSRDYEVLKKKNITDIVDFSAKSKIMRYGYPNIPQDIYSPIEIIVFVANYFKHKDGWPDNWNLDFTKLDLQARNTVNNLVTAGLIEKGQIPQPIQKSFSYFLNSTDQKLINLLPEIRKWSYSLEQYLIKYKTDLPHIFG
jgi:hypothetical protein